MKRGKLFGMTLFAACSVLVAVTSIQAHGGDGTQTAQEIPEALMRQKLQHAQDLLSALSIGDFDQMIAHSRELQRISIEARWSQPHSPAYADFGDDFRSALDRVEASAAKQNIDGAALNYVQVVLTCVQCHKVVREGEAIARAASADFGLLNFNAPSTGD